MIIYLLFFVTANILDWITVLSKGEESVGYIVPVVIWLCTIVGTAVLVKRGKIDICFMTDKTDLVPLILILILVVIRITIPDISYDTLNYHLFWQDSFGSDIVNYHFFPTRVINSLFFCLGDRIFHIFRSLLGYRAGVVLNGITLMLMYLQSKLFLRTIYGIITGRILGRLQRGVNVFVTAAAFLCVTAEQMLVELDTYYVDLLAIPFIMEALFRILFVKEQKNIDLWFLGIMAGVCTGIKPSNLVWIILILLLYACRFWKNYRWKGWVLGGLSAIFICLPYAFLSYHMTDNPVFPYMNTVFQSEWFFLEGVDEYSGMKELFGPSTLKEFLFWPCYMTFRSDRIHFSDYPVYGGRILAALLFGVFGMIDSRKDERHIFIKMSSIFILCYLLYLTCINGHLRYALFLEWYAGIILSTAFLCIFVSGRRKVYKAAAIMVLLMPMIFSVKWMLNYSFYSTGYVTRQSIFENKENWLKNSQYVFDDYGKQEIDVPDAAAFIVFDTNGSMMTALDIDVPVVNIVSGALTTTAKEKCKSMLHDLRERGKLYTLSKPGGLKQLLKEMEEEGYHALAIKAVKLPKISSADTVCYLVSVEEQKKTMLAWEGEESREMIEMDPQLITGETIRIFVGRKWGDMASDSETCLKIMAEEWVENRVSFDSSGNFYVYEIQVPQNTKQSIRIELESGYYLNKWMVIEY